MPFGKRMTCPCQTWEGSLIDAIRTNQSGHTKITSRTSIMSKLTRSNTLSGSKNLLPVLFILFTPLPPAYRRPACDTVSISFSLPAPAGTYSIFERHSKTVPLPQTLIGKFFGYLIGQDDQRHINHGIKQTYRC